MTEYQLPAGQTTASYRAERWGIERIVLDCIANHLPADSKGTRVTVTLKQGGIDKDLKTVDPQQPVEQITFGDNGKGYDVRLLQYAHSTKGADTLSVGQFGEGAKLAAAAAKREGIDLVYRSRDWQVTPTLEETVIEGETIHPLSFKVQDGLPTLQGSQTIFTNPTPALLAEVLRLPEKVLQLSDRYKEVYQEPQTPREKRERKYQNRILTRTTSNHHAIFVKGIRTQELGQSIFSYDLDIKDISPDRYQINNTAAEDNIGRMLRECTNPEVIRKLLTTAASDPEKSYYEFTHLLERRPHIQRNYWLWDHQEIFQPIRESYRPTTLQEHAIDHIVPGELANLPTEETGLAEQLRKFLNEHPSNIPEIQNYEFNIIEDDPDFKKNITQLPPKNTLWTTEFHKIFGEQAIIDDAGIEEQRQAELMGYTPVKIHNNVAKYLSRFGILRTSSLRKKEIQEYRWVAPEDLTQEEQQTLEYRIELERKLLGAPTNIPIQVYVGLYINDKEITTSNGVTIHEKGIPIIGIKRGILTDKEKFGKIYLHELGHVYRPQDHHGPGWEGFFVEHLYAQLANKPVPGTPQQDTCQSTISTPEPTPTYTTTWTTADSANTTLQEKNTLRKRLKKLFKI
ncbi:MAG: hypothetical protein Q7R96_05175 [Nanoarchaeota archaeon]|nr:hypothetical protein [Nanoarchaeota archaeon]